MAHKKLQRIYEDHIDSGYEVFVAPLVCDKSILINDDHIDDAEDGPDLNLYWRDLVAADGSILRASVDLIEHSIISYFAPHYNEKLVEWRAARPTDAMSKMRAARFRLIHIHLSGWQGLARFFSPSVPPSKSHLMSHDLPPVDLATQNSLRGISAERLSAWRFGSFMLREGHETLADLAENTGSAMLIFGDEAPAIRKPPGISLPPPVSASKVDARHQVRAEIRATRELERKKSEPLRHPGVPTYDRASGTIQVGEYVDGTPSRLRLHDPKTGEVDSVLIIGDPETGKSSALISLMLEGFGSAAFDIVPVDPSNKNDLEGFARKLYSKLPVATNLIDSIRALEVTYKIIGIRKEQGRTGIPSANNPGLLVGIDDSDQLLADTRGAELVVKILASASRVGVGLMIVVSDIRALESNEPLMKSLMTCSQKLAFMENGYYLLADLEARHGVSRQATWDGESITAIIRRDTSNTSVGIIVAKFEAELDASVVTALCSNTTIPEGRYIGNWDMVNFPDHWRNMDLNGKEWRLTRHEDSWVLSASLSTAGNEAIDSGADVIRWASSVISYRLEGEFSRWQAGPTTQGVATLYADALGEVSPKHHSLESTYRMFLHRY
ncbi:hypothetical protein ACIBO2_49500 [Nonomuraea sp. NPDC050022]|uniref:hypothetical protein n=1 Tax=Nonomuraea sp. NPDC050022 TaxID=3364358 RepID=UPI00379CA5B2